MKSTVDLTLNRDFAKNKNLQFLNIDFFKQFNLKTKVPWSKKRKKYEKAWFLKKRERAHYYNSCERCGTSFDKKPWLQTDMSICKSCAGILKTQLQSDKKNKQIMPYSSKIREIMAKKENNRNYSS